MLKHLTSLRVPFGRRSFGQSVIEYGAAIAVATSAGEAISQVGDQAADLFNAVGTAVEQSVNPPAPDAPSAP